MAFNTTPVLEDELVLLRPLRFTDFESLYTIAADSRLWTHHPIADGYTPEGFRLFFEDAIRIGSLAIIEKATDTIIGCTRLYNYDAKEGTVVIGHTFLATRFWGTGINQRVKKLMLDYLFERVKKVLFYAVIDNLRSQKALRKIGAVKTGRITRVYNGKELHCEVFEIIRMNN